MYFNDFFNYGCLDRVFFYFINKNNGRLSIDLCRNYVLSNNFSSEALINFPRFTQEYE